MKYFACLLNLLIQDSFRVGRAAAPLQIFSLSIWADDGRRESDVFNVFAKMDCILCQNAQKSSPNPPSSADDDAFQNE